MIECSFKNTSLDACSKIAITGSEWKQQDSIKRIFQGKTWRMQLRSTCGQCSPVMCHSKDSVFSGEDIEKQPKSSKKEQVVRTFYLQIVREERGKKEKRKKNNFNDNKNVRQLIIEQLLCSHHKCDGIVFGIQVTAASWTHFPNTVTKYWLSEFIQACCCWQGKLRVGIRSTPGYLYEFWTNLLIILSFL